MILITAVTASRILFSHRRPAVERIMFLSAVNILLGRMKRSATTNAGRFLSPDKLLNGKGIITTSPFTNPPMLRPLPACPSLLTGRLHSTAWFPVSGRVSVALSMPQNQQLRPGKPPEGSLFPVIKQRVQSSNFSYYLSIAKKEAGSNAKVGKRVFTPF